MLFTGVKGGAYKSRCKSLRSRALPVGGRVNQSLPYLSTGLFWFTHYTIVVYDH